MPVPLAPGFMVPATAPVHAGPMPVQTATAKGIIGVTGLRQVKDATKASLALTLVLGAPCPIQPEDVLAP